MRSIFVAVALSSFATACAAPQQPEPAPAAPDKAPETMPHHHAHDAMQHRFDDADKWAKVFDAPERDVWQKPQHVIELMGIEPGWTVADIGAGTGYFMPYLSAAVGPEGRVLPIDIEPALIAHIERRAAEANLLNIAARLAQPDDPGLDPSSVQRVLIVNTWHHIGNRTAYATKIAAGLAPQGALYIVDFTLETERGPPPAHRLSPQDVIAELAAAGLDASIVEETLPDQYVVVGVRR